MLWPQLVYVWMQIEAKDFSTFVSNFFLVACSFVAKVITKGHACASTLTYTPDKPAGVLRCRGTHNCRNLKKFTKTVCQLALRTLYTACAFGIRFGVLVYLAFLWFTDTCTHHFSSEVSQCSDIHLSAPVHCGRLQSADTHITYLGAPLCRLAYKFALGFAVASAFILVSVGVACRQTHTPLPRCSFAV